VQEGPLPPMYYPFQFLHPWLLYSHEYLVLLKKGKSPYVWGSANILSFVGSRRLAKTTERSFCFLFFIFFALVPSHLCRLRSKFQEERVKERLHHGQHSQEDAESQGNCYQDDELTRYMRPFKSMNSCSHYWHVKKVCHYLCGNKVVPVLV
jgi:hypothetical protein